MDRFPMSTTRWPIQLPACLRCHRGQRGLPTASTQSPISRFCSQTAFANGKSVSPSTLIRANVQSAGSVSDHFSQCKSLPASVVIFNLVRAIDDMIVWSPHKPSDEIKKPEPWPIIFAVPTATAGIVAACHRGPPELTEKKKKKTLHR